ncbi:hypothetical protein [Dinghuibacter silviterrae]|uniref:Uncharacterized protein n=1 Tax=Dinghuibacter silviterrae TaxID=1539049 RepID=A0A4R8DF12_9BACT|nr:hypothetical protein [Dinghuibacter silviterrae]TDW96035.1 hypothetical protein EDB95_3857 [Dinghuibacter silviterrae]
MADFIYSAEPGLLIGFHGCERSICDDIVSGKKQMKASNNSWDWLGDGVYFWQNNYERAWYYAHHPPGNLKIKKPADHIVRRLDCAVIKMVHQFFHKEGLAPFDSVRALFPEGRALYNGAGFRENTHIQIAIRNPNMIKGYFLPRRETKWSGYPLKRGQRL